LFLLKPQSETVEAKLVFYGYREIRIDKKFSSVRECPGNMRVVRVIFIREFEVVWS